MTQSGVQLPTGWHRASNLCAKSRLWASVGSLTSIRIHRYYQMARSILEILFPASAHKCEYDFFTLPSHVIVCAIQACLNPSGVWDGKKLPSTFADHTWKWSHRTHGWLCFVKDLKGKSFHKCSADSSYMPLRSDMSSLEWSTARGSREELSHCDSHIYEQRLRRRWHARVNLVAVNYSLNRHDSFQLSQWHSWRHEEQWTTSAMTLILKMVMSSYLPLLNNLTVILVSCFHHVQDCRQRMGSISHLLQSSRKYIQTQIRHT